MSLKGICGRVASSARLGEHGLRSPLPPTLTLTLTLRRSFTSPSPSYTPIIPTLEAHDYTDPELYKKERQKIFARMWQWAANTQQLTEPGSYVAVTLAGYPVIILRNKEGKLNAFHNVCSHRAFELLPSGTTGRCDVLRCQYHGWMYDESTGKLKVAREFELPPEANDIYALGRVKVEEWRGMVFVNLDKDAEPFAKAFEIPAALMKPYDLESLVFYKELAHDYEFNWKVYIDNYQEGYHIPIAHKALNATIKYSSYVVTPDENEGGIPYCLHDVKNADGSDRQGLWIYAFPNWFVNIYSFGMSMERLVPLDHNRSRHVLQMFYFDTKDPAKNEENRRKFDSQTDVVVEEDILLCEAVQRNLKAGVYKAGILNPKRENGVIFFQDLWRAKMGEE